MNSKPNEMRSNGLQFKGQDANRLRPFRNLQVEQFLGRHYIGEIVAERIELVHSIGNYNTLLILLVFEELLHSCVEIANVGGCFNNHFTVQHQLQPNNPVGRWMLGPHRNGHLRVERSIDDLELRWNVWRSTHLFISDWRLPIADFQLTPNAFPIYTWQSAIGKSFQAIWFITAQRKIFSQCVPLPVFS